MRKIRFIQKLVEEGKITIEEENDEVSQSYSQKAENSLKAAKILFEQQLLEESTSMSYYAMFHKATALFRLLGIKCENHAATILLLKQLFAIDNKDISFAKNERIDKQYYTDFVITQSDAKDLIDKAEQFIANLDLFLEKQTERNRKNYKQIFKQAYF